MNNFKKKIGYIIIGSILSIALFMPIAHAQMYDDHMQNDKSSDCCSGSCGKSRKLIFTQNISNLISYDNLNGIPVSIQTNLIDFLDIIEFYCQKSDTPIIHTFKTTVKRE